MSLPKRTPRRRKKHNKGGKRHNTNKQPSPLISAKSIMEKIVNDKSLLLDIDHLLVGIESTSNNINEISFNEFNLTESNDNKYDSICYISINVQSLRTKEKKTIILYDKRNNIDIDRITCSGNTKQQQLWINIRNKYIKSKVNNTIEIKEDNEFDEKICIETKIEKHLDNFYKKNKPKQSKIELENKLLKDVTDCIYELYPSDCIQIFQFGSVQLGLQTRTSDIDVAIYWNENKNPNKYIQQTMIQNLFKVMFKKLSKDNRFIFALFNAKCAIITIQDNEYNIEMDISIGDDKMIETSKLLIKLLDKYDNLGYNIRNIIIFIKYWASERNIKGLNKGYISSFAYTLMVIKFIEIMYIKNKLKANEMHFSQLIYEFFYVYNVDFDSRIHCVSIEENIEKLYMESDETIGIFDSKKTKNVLEIRDVINSEGNVTKGVSQKHYNKIKGEFDRAVNIIKQYKIIPKKQKQSLLVLLTS